MLRRSRQKRGAGWWCGAGARGRFGPTTPLLQRRTQRGPTTPQRGRAGAWGASLGRPLLDPRSWEVPGPCTRHVGLWPGWGRPWRVLGEVEGGTGCVCGGVGGLFSGLGGDLRATGALPPFQSEEGHGLPLAPLTPGAEAGEERAGPSPSLRPLPPLQQGLCIDTGTREAGCRARALTGHSPRTALWRRTCSPGRRARRRGPGTAPCGRCSTPPGPGAALAAAPPP